MLCPSESAPGGYVVRVTPSHPSDLSDGLSGYFETTTLVKGVETTKLSSRLESPCPVVSPAEVQKGVPVEEELEASLPVLPSPRVPNRLTGKQSPPPLMSVPESGALPLSSAVGPSLPESSRRRLRSKQPPRAEALIIRSAACASSCNPKPVREPPPLQTQTIGLEQVRRELSLWVDAMRLEYTNLLDKGVIRPVTTSQIATWTRQGLKLVRLPAKGVFTRKAVSGARRARCVSCGNHGPTAGDTPFDHRLLTYASGIDSGALRLALSFLSQHPQWILLSTDVKTAFLNAKLSDGGAGEGEAILVDPPKIFQTAGVVAWGECWLIEGALCGLDVSPKCWSNLRDRELKGIRLLVGKGTFRLQRLLSEPNCWLILSESADAPAVAGLLLVYVDDFLLGGEAAVTKVLMDKLCETWKCSPPEELSESAPLRCCGVEIARKGDALLVHQTSYVKDLIQRYESQLGHSLAAQSAPFPKIADPEESESPTPLALKRAQTIAGELLWLSGKTRVDILYGVSRITSLVAKCPDLAYQLGLHVLGYLKTTPSVALSYCPVTSRPTAVAYCDNQASVSIVSFDSGSWRTRHLRVRAHALRERITDARWSLTHLKGEWMIADVATKSLIWSRVRDLLVLCGYEVPPQELPKTRRLKLAALKRLVACLTVLACVQPCKAVRHSEPMNSDVDDASGFWFAAWVGAVGVFVLVIGVGRTLKSLSGLASSPDSRVMIGYIMFGVSLLRLPRAYPQLVLGYALLGLPLLLSRLSERRAVVEAFVQSPASGPCPHSPASGFSPHSPALGSRPCSSSSEHSALDVVDWSPWEGDGLRSRGRGCPSTPSQPRLRVFELPTLPSGAPAPRRPTVGPPPGMSLGGRVVLPFRMDPSEPDGWDSAVRRELHALVDQGAVVVTSEGTVFLDGVELVWQALSSPRAQPPPVSGSDSSSPRQSDRSLLYYEERARRDFNRHYNQESWQGHEAGPSSSSNPVDRSSDDLSDGDVDALTTRAGAQREFEDRQEARVFRYVDDVAVVHPASQDPRYRGTPLDRHVAHASLFLQERGLRFDEQQLSQDQLWVYYMTEEQVQIAEADLDHAIASAALLLLRQGFEFELSQLTSPQLEIFHFLSGNRLLRMHEDGESPSD